MTCVAMDEWALGQLCAHKGYTRTGWSDETDDTVLQTQDLKFEPCRDEAEQSIYWLRRFPAILNIYELRSNKQ